MGWIVPYVLMAAAVSWILNRIFDQLTAGMSGWHIGVARAGLFAVTWSAVITKAGMHGFTKRVRQLRRGTASAEARLQAFTKGDGQQGL